MRKMGIMFPIIPILPITPMRRACRPHRLLCGLALNKCPRPVLFEGDAQFFLRVHDNWAVPGDGFANGLSGKEQEAHRVIRGGDLQLLPRAELEQVPRVEQAGVVEFEVIYADGFIAERRRVVDRSNLCLR